jgi:glycosyltransferase involved in cell wall biosynthesis
VHVIPNGVPLLPTRQHPPRKRLVIGTAARLSPDKRLDQLLAAVFRAHSRLPAYEVRIAGGPDAGDRRHFRELERLARGLSVKWCGQVEDIPAFMADLDIFGMISEPGGCPNASLEAMAAGLPIVATDHGGAAEQVIHGVNGFLIVRGDSEAFADSLVMLANDAPMRARMGAASRERAASVFSLERMLDSYSSLLRIVPVP